MKRLRHRPEHLAQARSLRGGEANGPYHLLDREPQQLANGGRGAKHPGRSGDVPPDVVVRRIHRVGDARLCLETENERLNEITAANRMDAGIRKECGGHWGAWMTVVLRRRVVVVVDMRADAVHQRRMKWIQAVAAAEHAGRCRP